MIGRLAILAAGLAIGILLAWSLPELSHLLPSSASRSAPSSEPKSGAAAGPSENQQEAKLGAEAIDAAGIAVADGRRAAR